jgi:hypothetical protein
MSPLVSELQAVVGHVATAAPNRSIAIPGGVTTQGFGERSGHRAGRLHASARRGAPVALPCGMPFPARRTGGRVQARARCQCHVDCARPSASGVPSPFQPREALWCVAPWPGLWRGAPPPCPRRTGWPGMSEMSQRGGRMGCDRHASGGGREIKNAMHEADHLGLPGARRLVPPTVNVGALEIPKEG